MNIAFSVRIAIIILILLNIEIIVTFLNISAIIISTLITIEIIIADSKFIAINAGPYL